MTSKLSSVALTTLKSCIRGAAEVEETPEGLSIHRLPKATRDQIADPQCEMASSMTAGVRVEVTTTATVLRLTLHRIVRRFAGLPPRAPGSVDVWVDGTLVRSQELVAGDALTIDPRTGETQADSGGPDVVSLALSPTEQPRRVSFHLPHQETVGVVGLSADAEVFAAQAGATWAHYGSSISQGSNTTTPSSVWAARAALAANVELTNVGLSGSAMLDAPIARYLRDTPAELLSIKAGINLVGADAMGRRAFTPALHGFLDTVRDAHPETPLLVITPLYCRIHEHTPGPGAFDLEALAAGKTRFTATGDSTNTSRLTLEWIRQETTRIVRERQHTDANLYLMSGLDLYGAEDYASSTLPDELHPSPEQHRLIGDRFVALARGLGWLPADVR